MIVHWDEAERRRIERGHLRAAWTDLGRAAGSITVGVRRIELGAGEIPTPVHVHAAEEEIFYVLAGSGLSWQDGEAYEIAADDCLVHRMLEEEHTLRGGAGGLDVLAFGEREGGSAAHLPRAGVSWLFPTWVETGRGDPPWEREIAAGPPDFPEPSERPPRIVNLRDVAAEEGGRGGSQYVLRNLGVAAGSRKTGLRHYSLSPGKMGAPPHCHSAEEEIFVVLDGEGTLLLGGEEYPVHRGHVVSRPAGTRVAHAFAAGGEGLAYLAYGTREPNDIAYYPRSNKISWRGVGVIGRIEQLSYWDGEE